MSLDLKIISNPFPAHTAATKDLSVVRIDTITEIQKLIPTLINWRKEAKRRFEQATKKTDSARYESAREASNAFIRDFSSPKDFNERFYLVCYDANKQMQGCMLLSPAYLEGPVYEKMPYLVIDPLMTNPSNIPSSLIQTAQRISGVGSSLIKKAEEICRSESADGLILHPDPSSIEFYRHMGFEEIGEFMKKELY